MARTRIVVDGYERTPVILVVDDDWMNRELLQTHLEAAGYDVMTANNGLKALEAAAARVPDLVLLDVRMHGLTGYEVCARLKSQEATSHVPVVIVTALDSDGDYVKAVEAGADDFLPKPFNSVVMLARIRSLLRMKRLYEAVEGRNGMLRSILQRYVNPDTVEAILGDLES